jgi:hypothetical protein
MGVRNWIADKLFDINGTVQKEVGNVMESTFTYKIPGVEESQGRLLKYRQNENLVWSRNNAIEISKFYTTYKMAPGEMDIQTRQLFWEWASPISNIPKLHFPTPEIIKNQMNSLLFSEELMLDIKTGDEDLDVEVNSALEEILDENNFYQLLQTGSNLETYSGTLGARIVVNTEYEEYPIVKLYPAEKLKFKTWMGKIQEIIFLDEYMQNKKVYTLRSIYGKGYIKYELVDEIGKPQELSTVPELAELQDIVFVGKDGKPLKILMAVVKKNRVTSSEFPDMPYGGSDYEGLIDTFQIIDELYSTRNLYIRRSRPSMTLSEDRAQWDETNKTYVVPKEYEMDTLMLQASKNTKVDDNGFNRDIPNVNYQPYMDAIKDELKSVWMKIGMAYTSVGLEAHSANISNAALITKEKSTVIVRANKEKLWKKFLKDLFQLLLIYNSVSELPVRTNGEGLMITIPELFDYEYTVEFPEYAKQSFEERLDMVIKGLQGGVFNYETGIDRLFKDEFTDKEKQITLYKTKIENGVTIIQDEMPEDLETTLE